MRKAAAAVAAALVTSVASPVFAREPDPFEAMRVLRVTPATAAPDVTFRTLDGGVARIADFRGRPVFLTFFTTW